MEEKREVAEMRIGKVSWLVGLLALTGIVWPAFEHLVGFRQTGSAQATESRGVFYRLISKYEHANEIVDFDIVVGCNVLVTRYGDGDKSYDVSRDPVVYAKETADGGAIWQIVPNACGGETTDNGEVPGDFLPGAIWFESKHDFGLGIAYVTEDAYESQKSKLKFLAASIQRATQQEWMNFQSVAAENLVNPRSFTDLAPWPSEEEVKAHLWNKAKLNEWWFSSFECHGVARYELSEHAARENLRKHWPQSRPRFWIPPRETLIEIARELALFNKAIVNGVPSQEIMDVARARTDGFPTRARGGMIKSAKPWSKLPPVIFPMRAEDGIPWAGTKLAEAQRIFRDVDLGSGTNKGFAYCYSFISGRGDAGELHIPAYSSRLFLTRVDGEQIAGEESDDASPSSKPNIFFEGDHTFYKRFDFGFY